MRVWSGARISAVSRRGWEAPPTPAAPSISMKRLTARSRSPPDISRYWRATSSVVAVKERNWERTSSLIVMVFVGWLACLE